MVDENREVKEAFERAGFEVHSVDLISPCSGSVRACFTLKDFTSSCSLLKKTLMGTGWYVVDFRRLTEPGYKNFGVFSFETKSLADMEREIQSENMFLLDFSGRSVGTAFLEGEYCTTFELVQRTPVLLEADFDAWHVTPAKNLPRILERGLTPRTARSAWVKEFRPRAVYLSLVKPLMRSLVTTLDHRIDQEWALLRIQNYSDLPLYYDCEYGGQTKRYVFTTRAIPPDRIEVVETVRP